MTRYSAAKPSVVMVSSPRYFPMPWSKCTTRLPGLRSPRLFTTFSAAKSLLAFFFFLN